MKTRKIFEWARQRGYRIGVGGIDLLKQVSEELERKRTDQEIDPSFFEEHLSFIRGLNDLPSMPSSSVVTVAVPRPAHIIRFEVKEKFIEMVLPPTYVGYRRLFETVRQELEKSVFSGEVSVTTLSAPLKALANLMGIVSYGRNNLAYIPEFGSYFQLAGYLVDTLIPKTEIFENNEQPILPYCDKCQACTRACPMGAIDCDRFLIRAEKCYTRYSESPSQIPSGTHPPSPDCIIGCMKCQVVCPVNKGRLEYEDTGVLFSSEETHAILDPQCMNPQLSEAIAAKFSPLGLSESHEIFFRNLKYLVRHLSE